MLGAYMRVPRRRHASGVGQRIGQSGGGSGMAENTEGEGGVQRLTRRKRRTALERRGWALGLVAALLLGLSGAGMGYGAPGDLDPTFGTGGMSVTFGPHDGVR